MATTLADVKNKITYWVDDLLKGYFTDTQLNRFINDAVFEVQKNLIQCGQNYYLTKAETLLVPGQNEYVLPSDFLHLHRLEIVTQGHGTTNEVRVPIQSITLNQQDVYPFGSLGQPGCYYLKSDRIVTVPSPDTALYLQLTYSYRTAPLVLDIDVVDVPDEYCEMVALFAAVDCYIKDARDPSVLTSKLGEYRDMMKREAEDRLQDASRRIVMTGDGGYGALF